MKRTLTFLFFIVCTVSVFASTTEDKLNIAISSIASAIEDISDSKSSIVKIPVTSELSKELVEEVMKSVATSMGIRSVGILPISEMYELQTDKGQKFHKMFQYLDLADAMTLISYSTKLSTIYPIRIHLAEDFDGQLWLIADDIQPIIRRHQTAPKYIQDILYRAKEIVKTIMHSGATGKP